MIGIGANRVRKAAAAALLTLLTLMSSAWIAAGSDEAEASSAIDLAPGFIYTYWPSYPSDLEVETTIESCGDGLVAELSDGTLRVSVADGAETGTYAVVLKATSETGGISQVARQTLTFRVVSGLSVSGTIDDVVLGDSVDFAPEASSGMGTVGWRVKDGTSLPSGLELADGRVAGVPLTLGENTVSLTASAAGETKDLTAKFTVYPKIVGGDDETLASHGNTVESTAVENAVAIHVTWKVSSGTLPDGFALDPGTAVVSGSSSVADVDGETIVLVGTSSHGPSQTAYKKVTIRTENVLDLDASEDKVYVWDGKGDTTVETESSSETSDVTYSLKTQIEGVSVDSETGLVTVADAAGACDVTVVAVTEMGQSSTTGFSVVREEKLELDVPDALAAIAGKTNGADVSATESVAWSVDASGAPAGAAVVLVDGRLTLYSASPTASFDVVVSAETVGGQTASSTVRCRVYNAISFTSAPVAGITAYEG